MATAKKTGFIPKHYTLKGAVEWAFRGAAPLPTAGECTEVYGKECKPREVTAEITIKDKKT